MNRIQMVDLRMQYHNLKDEVNKAILDCLESSQFIGSDLVKQFEQELASFLNIKHVISCGNGTDALQLALMALDLPKGSKIIVPAFTYISPVEVIKLLGYEPVYADVDTDTFNITLESINKVYTKDVKAIIAVHLFGQLCDTKAIYEFAANHNCFLIEDNAQSLQAEINQLRNNLITTSFFPSKNLGAYGDGGAVMTNDTILANKIRQIANHGQQERYYHDVIGINSRLDALQAAILSVKLNYLDIFNSNRRQAADIYDEQLNALPLLQIPKRINNHLHTFHQYTIKVHPEHRGPLQHYLKEKGIDCAIYYPLPCYKQKAYFQKDVYLPETEFLCSSVLSLPIYPEISESQIMYICNSITDYFNSN